MFLEGFQCHLDPLRGFYVTFDEPLLRYVCRRFLPLAYGKHVVLHVIGSFQQIKHHELVIIVLDQLNLLSTVHHGG